MGITKTEGFTEETIEMADMIKALGHPARLAIFLQLANRENCVCGDLVAELPLAQSTVSQHLGALKKAGLIKGSITGNNLCYCIDSQNWNKMIHFLKNIIVNDDTTTCC